MGAADFGNDTAVKELLKAGADATTKNRRGDSALALACDRKIGRTKGHDLACSLLREAVQTARAN